MNIDLPGFADPVLESQAAFRAILDAMARPGTLRQVGVGLIPPAPLCPAAAAALLTLVDGDTRLFLPSHFAHARGWIAFHCSSEPVARADSADFVLADALPDFAGLDAGGDETPEASVTAIVQIASIGSGRRLRLSGPGLRAPAALDVDGLPDEFPSLWAANHALFPRGIDLLLCSGTTLAALPRSVCVEV